MGQKSTLRGLKFEFGREVARELFAEELLGKIDDEGAAVEHLSMFQLFRLVRVSEGWALPDGTLFVRADDAAQAAQIYRSVRVSVLNNYRVLARVAA